MKQRVALASALAPDPKVLLIDEPFPALDALVRAKLYTSCRRFSSSTRKTIVSVTHDPREAACLGEPGAHHDRPARQHQEEVRVDLPQARATSTIPDVSEYAARSRRNWRKRMRKRRADRAATLRSRSSTCCYSGCGKRYSACRLVPDYIFPSPVQVARKALAARDGRAALAEHPRRHHSHADRLCNRCSDRPSDRHHDGNEPCREQLFTESLFLGLQTLPTAAWVPISLLIFGLSD